jgi:hypothetical protein
MGGVVHYHLKFDLRLGEPECPSFDGEERLEFVVRDGLGVQEVTLNCRALSVREAFVGQPHHGSELRAVAAIEPDPATETLTLRFAGEPRRSPARALPARRARLIDVAVLWACGVVWCCA